MKTLIVSFAISMSALITHAQSVLQSGQSFTVGVPLVSPNGRFYCYYQADGNLVVYEKRGATIVAIWNSQTNGQLITNCVLQGDGNLVLYCGNVAKWNAGSVDKAGPYRIQMQNDGNLVIYNGNGEATWSTLWGLSDRLRPKPAGKTKDLRTGDESPNPLSAGIAILAIVIFSL